MSEIHLQNLVKTKELHAVGFKLPLIASTRARTGAQNMFSNDVKRVRFRCQTLKFSRPNVKFPRRLLLCHSPSYINKSSSTSLRKSSILFRLSICQWRDFHKFGTQFDCDTANDCWGNFKLGWENFKVWHLKRRRLTSCENMFCASAFTGRCNRRYRTTQAGDSWIVVIWKIEFKPCHDFSDCKIKMTFLYADKFA